MPVIKNQKKKQKTKPDFQILTEEKKNLKGNERKRLETEIRASYCSFNENLTGEEPKEIERKIRSYEMKFNYCVYIDKSRRESESIRLCKIRFGFGLPTA